MEDVRVYCLDEGKNSYETMTKEQILAAIEQAISTGTFGDFDSGFVTKIVDQNSGVAVSVWIGTEAAFNALETKEDNTLYIYATTFEDDVSKILSDVQTALANITNGTTAVAKATNAEHAKRADTATNADNASTARASVYLNGKLITVTLGGELSSSSDEAQIELFATGTAAEQLSVGSALNYNGEIAEITEFDGDTYTLACKKDGEFYSKLGQQIQVLTLIDYDKIINATNPPEILYSGNASSGTIQLSKSLAVGDKIRVCYGGDYQYFTITQSINVNTPTVTKTILKQLATGAENFADLQIHSIEMVISVGQNEITLKPIHTVVRLDTSTTFAARVEKISLSSDFSITEIARMRA